MQKADALAAASRGHPWQPVCFDRFTTKSSPTHTSGPPSQLPVPSGLRPHFTLSWECLSESSVSLEIKNWKRHWIGFLSWFLLTLNCVDLGLFPLLITAFWWKELFVIVYYVVELVSVLDLCSRFLTWPLPFVDSGSIGVKFNLCGGGIVRSCPAFYQSDEPLFGSPFVREWLLCARHCIGLGVRRP